MKKRRGASLLNVMVFMLFAAMITAQVFFFAKWSADSVAEEREIMMYRLNLDSLVKKAKDALRNTNPRIVHDENLRASNLKPIDENLEVPHETNILFDILKNYDTSSLSDEAAQYITSAKNFLTVIDDSSNKTNAIASLNELHDNYLNIYNNILMKFNEELNANKLTFSQFYEGNSHGVSTRAKYSDGTPYQYNDDTYNVSIHDLNYTFNKAFSNTDRENFINNYSGEFMYKKVFAAMPPDENGEYFLIRAWAKLPENYYGRKLMYQVLVRRHEDTYELDTLSFQEVWF